MNAPDHRTRVAEARRERMRHRLLVSALRLVASKGPDAVSIDDVIGGAEVSRGTFYKYFPAPEALVSAVAVDLANELITMAEPVVRRYEDPAERLACGLRIVSSLPLRLPLVASFLVRLGWPSTERTRLLLDYLRRDLTLGVQTGRFAPLPIELALNVVAGITIGTADVMLHSGDPALIPAATASVLRALGVSAAEAEHISRLPLPEPEVGGALLTAALSLSGRA